MNYRKSKVIFRDYFDHLKHDSACLSQSQAVTEFAVLKAPMFIFEVVSRASVAHCMTMA